MADQLINKLGRGMAAGIGLVSESVSAKKKQSAAKKLAAGRSKAGDSSSDTARSSDTQETGSKGTSIHTDAGIASEAPPTYDEAVEEHDDEQWDLDDAQYDLKHSGSDEPRTPPPAEEAESSSQPEKAIRNVHKLTDAFMAKYPVPEFIGEAERLGLPVVLPQRRPKGRHRGFIRAYAPILETKGIDQATFLEFIETFDQASQASPLIKAINLANFATVPLAPPFSILVSIALQKVVDVGTELHARRRTNMFLDRANNEFFRPRGLFCLVMTWNPESDQSTDTIDITGAISSRVAAQSNTNRAHRLTDQFSSSNGNTSGDIEFPQVAPLVFPALDELADQTGEEATTKKEKLKKAKNFVSEYFDRRAVAKYAGENPDSVLAKQAGQKPTFTSRYADPNHPAASGNLISLVTGGHINPQNSSFGSRGLGGGPGGQRDMYGNDMNMRGRFSRDPYGRDPYGRDPYGRDPYGRDPYGRDGYGRDGYGRDGFGRGGFGRGGFGRVGLGGGPLGLIGSLVDAGSRSLSKSQPAMPDPNNGGEERDLRDGDQYSQQQDQARMQGPGRGDMMGPGRGGRPNGYGPGRGGAMDNPLALLNPLTGITRILKQRVLYLMIVDMPTDEQLAAAAQELKRAA